MSAQPVTITAGIVPSRDVQVDGRNEDGTYGLMIESASIENREYLAGLDDKAREAYRLVSLDRDAVGTLYLDPATGVSYRLRGYHTDWVTKVADPSYSTFLPTGSSSSARSLPEGAFAIWSPAPVA